MYLYRRWPPSRGYRKVRRTIYSFIKKHPYCTNEEITNAMGWNYLGGGIHTYVALQELNRWGIIKKWLLYLEKPSQILTMEGKKAKKICTF